MIFLEVLVGTEVVILLKTWDQLEQLLDSVEHHVDKPTNKILRDLLQQADTADVEGYIQEELKQKPDMIAKNVRALNVAVEEDGVLQDLVEQFDNQMEKEPEKMQTLHSIVKDQIQRGDHEDSEGQGQDGKFKFHSQFLLAVILNKQDVIYTDARCGIFIHFTSKML